MSTSRPDFASLGWLLIAMFGCGPDSEQPEPDEPPSCTDCNDPTDSRLDGTLDAAFIADGVITAETERGAILQMSPDHSGDLFIHSVESNVILRHEGPFVGTAPLEEATVVLSAEEDQLSGFLSGDLNNDNTLDLVTAHLGPVLVPSAVFVFYGVTDASTLADADAVLTHAALSDPLVLGMGNVTGGDRPDLVVGSAFATTPLTAVGEGVIFVFADPMGDVAVDDAVASIRGAEHANQKAGFYSVADHSGDGVADVFVGSYSGDTAHLLYGPVLGDHTTDDGLKIQGISDTDTVGNAGDVDGDGREDLAFLQSVENTDELEVFSGNDLEEGAYSDVRLGHIDTNHEMAETWFGPGDVDGDGFADLLIVKDVAPHAVWLHYGPILGAVSVDTPGQSARIEAPPYSLHLGGSIAGGSDLDGDGGAEFFLSNYRDWGNNLVFAFYSP